MDKYYIPGHMSEPLVYVPTDDKTCVILKSLNYKCLQKYVFR